MNGTPRWFYEGGDIAAVQADGVFTAGFPFETLVGVDVRAQMLEEVLAYLGVSATEYQGTCDSDSWADPNVGDCSPGCEDSDVMISTDTSTVEQDIAGDVAWAVDIEQGSEDSSSAPGVDAFGRRHHDDASVHAEPEPRLEDESYVRNPPHPDADEGCASQPWRRSSMPIGWCLIHICTLLLLTRRYLSTGAHD